MPKRPPSETKTKSVKIGRDARTGRFISIKAAKRRPATTVIETIKRPRSKKK